MASSAIQMAVAAYPVASMSLRQSPSQVMSPARQAQAPFSDDVPFSDYVRSSGKAPPQMKFPSQGLFNAHNCSSQVWFGFASRPAGAQT